MRELRRQRRAAVGKVRFETHATEISGDLVIETIGVSFAYPNADKKTTPKIIDNLTTTIMRGDKIGVIGPNGSGKTTLLKLLLGLLRPTDGVVKLGTKLEIAYFDQLHAQLDENKSVWENVADGYSSIRINGREKNVVGYLQDFLFTPQQARNLVQHLSGGERNRLLLARLFAKPSNVLVMDEPTNDLDMETLELLEELLVEYKGTVLLVSHDRAFINDVVTGTFVLEGRGRISEFVGGYDDWIRQRKAAPLEPALSLSKPEKSETAAPAAAKKKLSFKEQKELESLHPQIEKAERELASLHEQMAQPAFYKQSSEAIAKIAQQVQQLDEQVAALYARWEQLER
jgi:ATP-binding cassette subfamily F protein uup